MEKLTFPSSYQEELINFNFNKLHKIENYEELENQINSIGDSESVLMGDYLKLSRNEYTNACSYGAGPCIAGVLKTKEDELYMFHCMADCPTIDQDKLLQNAKDIIVGSGDKKGLQNFAAAYSSANIRTLLPPGDGYDFNMVFVKEENEYNVEPGFYYCYDSYEFLDEESEYSDNRPS